MDMKSKLWCDKLPQQIWDHVLETSPEILLKWTWIEWSTLGVDIRPSTFCLTLVASRASSFRSSPFSWRHGTSTLWTISWYLSFSELSQTRFLACQIHLKRWKWAVILTSKNIFAPGSAVAVVANWKVERRKHLKEHVIGSRKRCV